RSAQKVIAAEATELGAQPIGAEARGTRGPERHRALVAERCIKSVTVPASRANHPGSPTGSAVATARPAAAILMECPAVHMPLIGYVMPCSRCGLTPRGSSDRGARNHAASLPTNCLMFASTGC